MSGESENLSETTTSLVVSAALDAAKASPEIKATGVNLAKAALTVSKTVNNLLLPLAALNYGVERAKSYFEDNFTSDITAKLRKKRPEDIVELKASVAGPALSGLAFTHDEPDLKEVFLELLVSSMDKNDSEYAHPAFAEMIKQMTSFEARLSRHILSIPVIPIIKIKVDSIDGSGYRILYNNVIPNVQFPFEFSVDRRTSTALDNLTRLGLINIDYMSNIAGDENYAWTEGHPYIVKCREDYKNLSHQEKIGILKGIATRTDLGLQFAVVVGCFQNNSVPDENHHH